MAIGKIKRKKAPSLPRNYKSVVKSVSVYREMRAAGKVGKISSMEKLLPFVGAKGGLLKGKVKSKKGAAEFSEAVAAVKRDVGRRPGKKTFIRHEKAAQQKREKAAQTYAQHNIPDKRFTKVAREQAAKYNKMVDVFASDTYNRLREGAYGIGSDVVEKLLDEGLSEEDVEKYLKQVMQTLEDIPAEARSMANRDDFWQAVIDLSKGINDEEILRAPDVFNAYLNTEPENREDFENALANYAVVNDDSMSFSEVWDQLQNTMDPGSIDNMIDIYGGTRHDILRGLHT